MKSNKKAFTIVELVIVIAIIAVLAAVLIPTFANVINKANVSKDTQLIRNLNTALASSRASNNNKPHQTLYDALQAAEAFGYDVGKINTSALGNEILWDQENDVFCYLEGNEVVYLPELVDMGKRLSTKSEGRPYHLWKIFNDDDPFIGDGKNPHGFSIYWNGAAKDEVIIDGLGFDAGTSSVSKISYSTTDTRNVVIRTNSANTSLTVNAPNDTVNHYGNAGSVDIIAVANKSYHENGNVAFLEIAKGRVVLESESKVKQIHISTKVTSVAEDGTKTKEANTFDKVIVALASGVEAPDFSRDEVALNSIGDEGTLVVEIEKGNNQSDFIYLYQQGLVEQIRVTTGASTNSADNVEAKAIDGDAKTGNDSSLSSNTSSIATDIANNLKAGSMATPEQIAAGTVDVNEIEEAGLTEEAKETAKETAVNDAMVDEYSESRDKAIPENAVAYNINSQTYYAIDDDHATGMAALRAALDGADSKDVILLMNDVTITQGNTDRFNVSKSVTLNGNNHTVTINGRGFGVGVNATSKIDVTFKNITIINSSSNGRGIDTRGNLNGLTLDNVTIKTPNSGTQPLTIGGNQSDIVPVTIKNSVIETSEDGSYGYAITTFNPVNMNISDSTIKGWACLNLKGPDSSAGSSGSSFSIDNTNLVSKNTYSGYSNAYAIIKMEAAGINVNFILRGCTFDIDGANNTQYIVSFKDSEQNPVSGCVVAIGPGNTINLKGDATFDSGTGNGSVLYITGGTFNVNPTGHLVDGYAAHDNGDGTWTVVPQE